MPAFKLASRTGITNKLSAYGSSSIQAYSVVDYLNTAIHTFLIKLSFYNLLNCYLDTSLVGFILPSNLAEMANVSNPAANLLLFQQVFIY